MLGDGLRKTKTMGAEACVFGDINTEDHKTWCTQGCAAADIGYKIHLLQESREG